MKKGIQLEVRVRITGEAEPAFNWAAYTMEALQKMIEVGSAQYPQLSVNIRSVAENTDYEEDPWSAEESDTPAGELNPPPTVQPDPPTETPL